MKHRTAFGAIGMVLLAAGCTEDPLASLRAGPARLVLSAAVLAVNVADSVAVTATAVDEQGNPLPDVPTATSTTPTIVSVSTGSGAPLPQARFYVKGVAFGTGNVDVTVGSVTKSIKVNTYPASVAITGQLASLGSGTTVVLTAVARSATGQVMAGVTPTGWSSDDEAVVSLTPAGATATATGKTPGVASVTVTFTGGLSTTVPVLVVAGPFTGTLSAASGDPADIVTITRTVGAPPFDDDTEILMGGQPVLLNGSPTADAVEFAVPLQAASGAKSLLIQGIGDDQIAQLTTFTINSTSDDDQYEPANNDPLTSPVIAADGDYFVILHGDCDGGVPTSGSDDCDDVFTITNNSGSDIDVTSIATWVEGADVDIIWCVAVCFDFSDYTNVDGATGANPEDATVTLAPGETQRIWLSLFEAGPEGYALVRLSVSGVP